LPEASVERGEGIECFLVNRSNAAYSFWSIPPVNDFAMLSIKDGVQAIVQCDTFGFFTDQRESVREDGVLQREPISVCDTGHLKAPQPSLAGEGIDVTFQRAAQPFLPWKGDDGQTVSLVPAVVYAGKGDEGELGWIETTDPVNERLLTFEQGWAMIRTEPGSPVCRQFERLYERE
jgi:hypothetical protein